MTFQARLRVKIAKPLTTDECELAVVVDGRPIKVVGGEPQEKLSDAKWLTLTAAGFDTEDDAREFGDQLRERLEVASFACRLGIDGGDDRSSMWINEEWALELGIIKRPQRLHPNVHGVMVVPDDGLNRFPVSNVTAKVTADPASFVDALQEADVDYGDTRQAAAAVRVMNQALMTNDPLAQVVLAFSAVEELGQSETWTPRQRELLAILATELDTPDEDQADRAELAAALRSLHRLSLRQGVLRALKRLGLSELKSEWDRLYGIRSGIFHGTNRLAASDASAYAAEVVNLCGKVVLAQLRQDGVVPPQIAATHYS